MTQLLHTAEQMRRALAAATASSPAEHPVVGYVPTMGALHAGHRSLLEAARSSSDLLISSIFVNPLQFDDDADYRHYPRQLSEDLALLEDTGADLVFAPELEEMYPGYPASPRIRVSAGEMGRKWEGASRPGHFDGVVTVVTKLFSILTPPAPARLQAWFGQKDAEQVAIIRRLTEDLNLPAEIRVLPTVRDENGLALSSRNQRLSAEDYPAALELSAALRSLAERARAGQPLQIDQLRTRLDHAAGVEPDYLVVVDPATLEEIRPEGALLDADGVLRGPALALVAARVGPVRLIDNMEIQPD
ncbi:pantoate--beta-alanine ligase [Nesterenkonia sp.]|uniref:pantoate--beta-alanine ligase n=1 Tax=Nesterenkonia sp. TaxID=704201 RepID=UPI0026308459|nr:pantoate--beta-alanine ligase [Nesterenkonia sp.]